MKSLHTTEQAVRGSSNSMLLLHGLSKKYRTRRGGVPSPTVIADYAAKHGQAWKSDPTKCLKNDAYRQGLNSNNSMAHAPYHIEYVLTCVTDSVTMGFIGGDTMSTETTVFSVRMDASVKDSLDAFCAAVGMNTNTAINMFARVVAREKRLPFDVAIDPFYDERNIRHLLKVKADIESGAAKLTKHELIEVDDD